jgi:predicted phage terminase large subunit-like protein
MKNYPNLEHIINESKEWLYDSDAKWNEVKHIWEFPGGGRLQFGNVDKEDDVFKYRSFQYQFMGFDEVTRLSGDQYLKLTSRMRKTNNMQVPIRIRAATNPGGGVAGHTFIKERFISEDTRHPKTLFIPSNIHDNPHLDAEDYIETLMELPLVERERLLNGNWDIADTGSLIDQGWFVKVTEPEQSVWEKTVRVWDIAATVESAANADPDWTAGALCSFKDGKFTVEDINYFRGTPKTVEEKIIAQYEIDKELFGRPIQTFIEMGMNSAAKIAIDSYLRGPFSGFDIRAISSNISKEERARSFMVAAENGLVNLVVAGWNKRFFEECLLFGSGLRRAKDDGIDAVVHGFNRLVVQGSRRGRVSSMAARRAVSSKSLLHVVRR